MTDRVSILEKIQNEARNLFKKKNQDYGDAFANYGPIGVLVRIGDKISRLQSITTNHGLLQKKTNVCMRPWTRSLF